MADVWAEFVPDWQGIRELFNSPAIQKACLAGAEEVAQAARHGLYHYKTDAQPGKNVAHGRCTWDPAQAEREMGEDYYRYKHKDPAFKALKDAVRGYGGKVNNG